jgi:Protein of unknown function (DUF3987)
MDSYRAADSGPAFTLKPDAAVKPKVAIRFTRFEKPAADGPMTKTIKLGADGQPDSDASKCKMWRGKAEVLTVEGAAGLAAAIDACTSQQAFAMGIVKPELAGARTKFSVVKKDALADAAKETIARSKDHLEFAPGQPAAMPLDFDPKGMSFGAELSLHAAGGCRQAVIDVAPELAEAAWVVRASTSAGLVDTRTGKDFPGSGGLHGYVLVKDGSDIPRAIETLYDRARLKGYGWSLVSAAGSILPRSIIDASKGDAHDLVFEGPPLLSAPLAQDAERRKPRVIEGGLADTRMAISDLTDAERAELKAIDEAEQQELAEEARPIREAQIEKRVRRAIKAGSTASPEELRKRFAGAYAGRLPAEFVLTFDDRKLGDVTVAEVLADLPRHSGKTLADPLEGLSYGKGTAKLMPVAEGDNEALIHSFAHGRMVYVLSIPNFTIIADEGGGEGGGGGDGNGDGGGGGGSGADEPETDADHDDDAPVDLWKAFDAPPLPVGLLPPRVETFVWANAKAMGADAAGLAGASIAAIAAAMPDSVRLQVMARGEKWLIAARQWVALLGGPSTKKTPIMNAATAALEKADWRRRDQYESLKSYWDAKSKTQKADAMAAGDRPPPHNRIIIGDATPEAAADVLATSPNGVLASHDELSGFFGQMERYGKNGADRPFWLRARDGGPFSIERKTSGSVRIPHLSVTLLGGIQPEPMRKVADGSADDGLIQRLTPIMLRPAELTDDDVDTADADRDFAALIETLLELAPGERPLRFDEGAQRIRREIEIEHYERTQRWEGVNRKLSSAFGKQDGVFAELCVIWHGAENAERNPLPELITEETARRVAEFMRRFLRPHLVAFYFGVLDLADGFDELRLIGGYILTHKPETMNSREVQKSIWSMKNLGSREVTAFMEQLEAFGWLFRHPPPRAGALPVWRVNLAVHTYFAKQAKKETERRAKARATIAKDVAARRAEHD